MDTKEIVVECVRKLQLVHQLLARNVDNELCQSVRYVQQEIVAQRRSWLWPTGLCNSRWWQNRT
jgi:hypothetical protein